MAVCQCSEPIRKHLLMEEALPFLLLCVHACVCVMTLFSFAVTATEVSTTVAEITMKEITRCLYLWVEVPSGGWGSGGARCTGPSAGFHFLW